jgi:hypothetical protein
MRTRVRCSTFAGLISVARCSWLLHTAKRHPHGRNVGIGHVHCLLQHRSGWFCCTFKLIFKRPCMWKLHWRFVQGERVQDLVVCGSVKSISTFFFLIFSWGIRVVFRYLNIYIYIYIYWPSDTTLYCVKYISKWYLKDNGNYMFRLSFLSHLQVATLGYFNIQLTPLLSTRSRLHKF